MSGDEEGNYIVEFVSVGDSMKVTAIDPVSMKEVSIVANPRATRKELAQLAVRKLEYVLNRDRDADGRV